VGGVFAPAGFPAKLRGTYLFADWARGWLKYVRLTTNDAATVGSVRTLATKLPGPVALHLDAAGRLYYLALNSGDLRRVDHVR
jgi:hypothetical protein